MWEGESFALTGGINFPARFYVLFHFFVAFFVYFLCFLCFPSSFLPCVHIIFIFLPLVSLLYFSFLISFLPFFHMVIPFNSVPSFFRCHALIFIFLSHLLFLHPSLSPYLVSLYLSSLDFFSLLPFSLPMLLYLSSFFLTSMTCLPFCLSPYLFPLNLSLSYFSLSPFFLSELFFLSFCLFTAMT